MIVSIPASAANMKGCIMVNARAEHHWIRNLGWVILVLCLCEIAAAEGPVDTEVNPFSPGVQMKMQKLISVDFRQMPIDDVLRVFSDQGEMDIIKSPKVEGLVTATITDVPLGEALNNILAAHDYGYVATANMIRIVPRAEVEVQKEKLISKVYTITYADVGDIEKALKKFISAQGKISANPGTSNLIVTDTESQVLAIDAFIAEIDRITPQILVEASIYDISSTDQLDLGIQWGAARTVSTDENGFIIGGHTDPYIGAQFESSINRTTKTADSMLQFGILTEAIDITAVLHAKQDEICAKLLANPRILVLDNETAHIKIVSELPFQQLTQTSGGGNIGTTEFKEVGVELIVTPHVTREGLIRLKLRPIFSVQVDTVAILLPTSGEAIAFPQPVVDKREAQTTALIKDNQTVVIGGLRKKDVAQEISKVPLLGDLPLLGNLFKFTGEKTVNSELVVFIKPRIVTDPTLSDSEAGHLAAAEEALCTPACADLKADRCVNVTATDCTGEECK